MDFDDFYTYTVATLLAVMASAVGYLWQHPRKDEPQCDDDASPPP
jgi:hypothetical protein